MAIMDIKATLKNMVEGGNEFERLVADIYLKEIEKAKLDDAKVVVETKKSAITYLLNNSDAIISTFIGEYCKAVELELKTGDTILLVYLTPSSEL